MVTEKKLAWSQPGNRYAVCVGINNYGADGTNNLRGCLNDCWDWAKLLESMGWPHDNIRMLTDQAATRDAIIQRIRWLVSGAKSGDRLVFVASGHGTQVRDRNGDELSDGLDEAFCAANALSDWDHGLVLDDDLAVEFQKLPTGAHLTVCLDSCHSGSGSREMTNPHDYKKLRYLDPPMHIQWRAHGQDLPVKKIGRGVLGWIGRLQDRGVSVTVPKLNHVLLAGCKDSQTSADAYINGAYCGAFSYYMKQAIRANAGKTVADTVTNAARALKAAGYSQDIQVEGSPSLLGLPIFG